MAVRRSIQGLDGPEPLARALGEAQYVADEGLATAAFLALALTVKSQEVVHPERV